jgi:pimeloyl-ACP methyl ester carboxylesterase
MSDGIAPPHRMLLWLEGRALVELAAVIPALPFLRRASRGDGHPVLVYPGLGANDFSTRTMRAFLRDRGYHVHGWKLGTNLGPTPERAEAMVVRLHDIHARHGRRVSLIGWSLGGIYARELARRHPELVRQVITLASPFRDVDAVNIPRFLRRNAESRPLPDQEALRARLAAPLAVPSTALYSRTDGIVAWQSCREDEGPERENIEIMSSHLGIGHHPVALLTIADRLAQPEGAWRPFRLPAGWRWPLVPRLA